MAALASRSDQRFFIGALPIASGSCYGRLLQAVASGEFGIERDETGFGGLAGAAFGDEASDQPRRRDVKTVIGGLAAFGRDQHRHDLSSRRAAAQAPKSVVSGQRVSVLVELVWRRLYKKKKITLN